MDNVGVRSTAWICLRASEHRASASASATSASLIKSVRIPSRPPFDAPRAPHPNTMKEAEMTVVKKAAVMPPVRVMPHITHALLPAR
ncbi:hypothetical protein PSAC2689_30326 [Paraburkholderia sacchari]